MNLAFSDEQRFIQDQANNFLQTQCSVDKVRSVLESDTLFDQDLWQQMVELGWTALSIPEEFDGLGLGFLELCLIAEELGKVLAPVPFLSSVVLATEVLKATSDTGLKQKWLPQLASGNSIGCVGLNPHQAKLSFNNGYLSGEVTPLFDAGIAQFALVTTKVNDKLEILLVELHQEGVSTKTLDSIDPSKNISSVTFNQASAVIIPFEHGAEHLLKQLLNTAAVIVAFEQFGGAEKAMHTGIEYTKNRYAFGRQVASFQAIKHKFADMFVALELAKSNAFFAAWALSTDDKALNLAAATARVSATDAYFNISKENIEVHGGMGFTWEFDCHLYYRRAQYLSSVIGTLPVWQEKLVDALIDNGIPA